MAEKKTNTDRIKRVYELCEEHFGSVRFVGIKYQKQLGWIAKAQLEEVKNQYRYLHIKAPNSGVVVAKNIKVGEMAMPGVPAIVLSDLSNLKISAEIAENELSKIKHGTRVRIRIPSLNIKTTGRISAIIPSSNPMTHTFKIKISFRHSSKSIYPGMYATVDIK